MKRKGANFGHQVKVGKLKLKVCNVRFLSTSFIKRARALIFDLHEGTIYSFVKFKYESFTSYIECAFEEKKEKKKRLNSP